MDKVLALYQPSNDLEALHKDSIVSLLQTGSRCFYRDHFNPGHITGSGLLISHDNSRVLMNHHKSLNKWLSFGGHADGDENVMRVAMREVMEESGIENIEAAIDDIFDVDVHPIPANPKKGEPAHAHYDIRYLFRVKDKDSEIFALSDESVSLRWCAYEEASVLIQQDDSMMRLLTKWQANTGRNPL